MPQNKSPPMTPGPMASTSAQQRLALDLQTIWRSELQALAVDREAADALEIAVQASAALQAAGWAVFDSGRAAPSAGADAPPRATTVAVSPDAHDSAIVRLERRVAELERLLAQFGSSGG